MSETTLQYSDQLTPEAAQQIYDDFNSMDVGNAVSRAEMLRFREAARVLGQGAVLGETTPGVMEGSPAILTEAYVQDQARAMQNSFETSQRPEDKNTAEVFQYLPPTKGVSIKGREFFLSAVVSADQRAHCVGYTRLEDGTFAPRLFYKSFSDGDWRVSPDFEVTKDESGSERARYSKGETMDFGYVRETRLHDDLRSALQGNEAVTHEWNRESIDWLTRHFTRDKLGVTYTYEDEVDYVTMRGANAEFYGFKPGHGFESKDGRPAREIFASAAVSEMLQADFSKQPVRVLQSEHPQLGVVTTEVYDGWHMSHDEKGRVWVSGITNEKKQKPNTYGTDDEVVSAGVYDNKPLEYASQVSGLEEGVDFNAFSRTYVDITPLLDNLPAIRQYRQARGIQRLA